MRKRPLLALFTLLFAAAACSPSLIPGTEIEDSDENREIIDVVAAYKKGLEERNVESIMRLVSPSYFENSGTPEPADDADYTDLQQKLTEWARQASRVRADIRLKAIQITGKTAKAQYFYEMNYQMPGVSEIPTWSRQADTAEFAFVREENVWRFVRGL